MLRPCRLTSGPAGCGTAGLFDLLALCVEIVITLFTKNIVDKSLIYKLQYDKLHPSCLCGETSTMNTSVCVCARACVRARSRLCMCVCVSFLKFFLFNIFYRILCALKRIRMRLLMSSFC